MLPFLNGYIGWGTVALRLALGVVFIVHGWAKARNPEGIAQAVWRGYKPLGLIHGLVEIGGGIALIVGMWLDWVSLVLAVIIIGAIYYKAVKWKTPFWAHDNTGWEFDLVILAGLLALLLG